MTRALQLFITLTAALTCAGCNAIAIAAKRAEIRHIEQDWAAHKPHKPFIYP